MTRALLLLGLALAAAIPLGHREKVRQLQAANPTATAEACAACVASETDLTIALDTHAASIALAEQKAVELASAENQHGIEFVNLGDMSSRVASQKAAVSAALQSHGFAVSYDSPESIISGAAGLGTVAQSWKDAIDAHAAQVALVATHQGYVDDAKKAHDDAVAAKLADEATVALKRGAASSACNAMRATGYGYVAPAPVTVAPTATAPVTTAVYPPTDAPVTTAVYPPTAAPVTTAVYPPTDAPVTTAVYPPTDAPMYTTVAPAATTFNPYAAYDEGSGSTA